MVGRSETVELFGLLSYVIIGFHCTSYCTLWLYILPPAVNTFSMADLGTAALMNTVRINTVSLQRYEAMSSHFFVPVGASLLSLQPDSVVT